MFGWLKPKAKVSAPALNDDMRKAAVEIVNAYDHYLESHPIGLEIRDVSFLPYEKKVILNAIIIELSAEAEESVRQFLMEIGLRLANFREGIGARELSMMPPGLSGVTPETLKLLDAEKLAAAMADHKADFDKHAAVSVEVTKERRELATLLDRANEIAANRTGGRRS